MLSRIRFVALTLIVTLLAPHAGHGQNAAPGPLEGALAQPGAFEPLQEPLRRLLQLRVADGRLQLDRAHWDRVLGTAPVAQLAQGDAVRPQQARQAVRIGVVGRADDPDAPPVERLFWQIQQVAGATSSGSSFDRGGSERSVTFTGRALSGSLVTYRQHTVRLEFREPGAAGRLLEIEDVQGQSMRLMLTHPSGELLLLSQTADGPISLVILGDGQPVAHRAASFAALYADQRELVEQQLLPLLERIGIGAPLLPHSPAVRAVVLARLRPAAQVQQEAQTLLERLDADDFQQRQQATAALAERWADFQPSVQQALARDDLSAEARYRLQRLVDEHGGPAPPAGEVVEAMKLLNDVAYLVELLEAVDDADRTLVAARLTELTGQDLGTDDQVWRRWQQTHPQPREP